MPKEPDTTMVAMRIMIPTTTINSISVNPLLLFMAAPSDMR